MVVLLGEYNWGYDSSQLSPDGCNRRVVPSLQPDGFHYRVLTRERRSVNQNPKLHYQLDMAAVSGPDSAAQAQVDIARGGAAQRLLSTRSNNSGLKIGLPVWISAGF